MFKVIESETLLVPRSRLKEKKVTGLLPLPALKLWNSLPVSIRTIETESLFKTRLKATSLRGLLMYEPTGVYYFRLLFVCLA